MSPIKRILVLAAVISICSAPSGVGAGPADAPADSVCYHFTGNANLTLKSGITLSGRAPVSFCDMRRGEKYRLTVDGAGLERRLGTLTVGPTGTADVSGIRLRTSLRNMLPGFGAYDIGMWEVGVTDEMTLAASLYLFYVEHREYEHLETRYTIYRENLASTDLLESKQIIERAARQAAVDVNVQNEHRKRIAAFSAYIYGWQILDPFFIAAPPKSRAEEARTIRLDSPGRSKPKALFLSLVRPGRGQFYQGKKGRGAVFSILTSASVLAALEFHNRYDVEESAYELLLEDYDVADTISDKERIARAAALQWDDVEKARRRRNAAYIVTAGLWGLNLIDALFESGGAQGISRYSLEMSPGSSMLVIRF